MAALLVTAIGSAQDRPAATPQRPTFSSDASTAAPGTLQLEFGTEANAGNFTLPAALRMTPPTESGLFHQLEFSLEFDTLERIARPDGDEWRFGDSLDVVIRRPLWKGERWSFALAPRAEFFLRGDSGARLGGRAIAVYGFGLNSLVANVDGTAATAPSSDNPEWRVDLILGYTRALSQAGVASRFSIFFEFQDEFPNQESSQVSLLQGIAYRIAPYFVLDIAVEQRNINNSAEWLLLGGLTYNLGRLWRRR